MADLVAILVYLIVYSFVFLVPAGLSNWRKKQGLPIYTWLLAGSILIEIVILFLMLIVLPSFLTQVLPDISIVFVAPVFGFIGSGLFYYFSAKYFDAKTT
ncbi:MAG: hypothetical protein CSA11_12330 [Chloroflexi bacterium]|nr:MAG: hypothetical protein CSA11_12330 [Chloroflexota bacterium]